MGLDTVEIVIRVEETFALELPNADCEQIRTVGDLYRLVLEKLGLAYQPAIEMERMPPPVVRQYDPWTTAHVWITLKTLIIDQLQVDDDEVCESASFQADLGAD